MNTLSIHEQAYEYYDWETLGTYIFQLARQIIDQKLEFDRLVALAKGGLTFSRSLVDYALIPELSSLQIEFYTGIGQTAKTPVITQSLPVTVKNERILIFDDIVDTGETMELAVKYLQYHGAASISTASLFTKPWTRFHPDLKVQESQAWIIFPNESRETINTLKGLWQKKGDSEEQIHSQLLQIGFPESEVALFHTLK